MNDKGFVRFLFGALVGLWLLVGYAACVSTADAQIIRRPGIDTCLECPPIGSFWCNYYPEVCAQCWAECGFEPGPPPRQVIPLVPMDYTMARGVGVTQLAYDLSRPEHTRHFTTAALMDELVDNNINIIKLWLNYNPFDGAGPFHWHSYGTSMGDLNLPTHPSGYPTGTDYRRVPMFEDMDFVWRDPRFETIVVRFIGSGMWDEDDPSCTGWTGPFWVNEPTYDIASKLLRRYGEQDKLIIITDWENDNQWSCGGTVTPEIAAERMLYVKMMAESRQRAVEQARAENPDAALRVMFAVIANDFDELPSYYGMNITKDMIPFMDPQPDLIGFTYWSKHLKPITEVMDYIMMHTGYPASRIYLDEIGAPEKTECQQYDRIMPVVTEFFEAGGTFACVWMWRQTWYDFTDGGKPINMGMWKWAGTTGKVEWLNEPTSGLAAIQELNDDWR